MFFVWNVEEHPFLKIMPGKKYIISKINFKLKPSRERNKKFNL